ncbi:MAG: Trans-hexaprenyltranstransferase [Peptococcaceae bacterium]|nr:Trans-hexaprenyltranstransferase [Peptococcaceae bacterium]
MNHLFYEIEGELRQVEEYLLKYVQAGHADLRKSFVHLLRAGGKRIRPAFVLLAAKYGQYNSSKIIPLAAALELIHMATLVHDDVIDSSIIRRGRQTVKAKYGNNFSLHSGDFLFAKALTIIENYKSNHINQLLAHVSVEMCQGELEQIASAYKLEQNIRNYFYRIKRKTSLLISASCQIGAIAAQADPHIVKTLGRYGHYLGMAFQITDDVLDFIADEKTLGKPVGSDLRQGIITLPVIYLLNCGNEEMKKSLWEKLNSPASSQDDLHDVVELIKQSEAIPYSLDIAGRYVEKALKELEVLPANEITESLHKLAVFIKRRQF